MRSINSLKARPLSPWKLMLRDGLNLYGVSLSITPSPYYLTPTPPQAICLVNLANMLFWFIIRPTGIDDPIRTIVTSMAAVLTTSMSLRIILSVRGTLEHGGSFALSNTSAATSSRTTHVLSGGRSHGGPTNISTQGAQHTYTLDELRTKPEGEWTHSSNGAGDPDNKSSVHVLGDEAGLNPVKSEDVGMNVKITIDREIGYDDHDRYKN